jgi:hypothetical protein
MLELKTLKFIEHIYMIFDKNQNKYLNVCHTSLKVWILSR